MIYPKTVSNFPKYQLKPDHHLLRFLTYNNIKYSLKLSINLKSESVHQSLSITSTSSQQKSRIHWIKNLGPIKRERERILIHDKMHSLHEGKKTVQPM